jgi:integrase
MDTGEIPYVRPWRDRHGKIRWRFRRGKRTVYLPDPTDPAFHAAYQAALGGLPAPVKARVVKHPSAAAPRSLRAAWRAYTTGFDKWQAMESETRMRQAAIAEEFLNERVVEDESITWGEMPVSDLRRRHLRKILVRMADRPHAARHRLNVIRKIILAALEEEWIETDPSYRLEYRPATIAGWRAWKDEELSAFEARWSIGTMPRLVYELALWLGPGRSDLARLRPEDLRDDKIGWTRKKTGTLVTMPITSFLRIALDAADLSGPTIVKTAAGNPFSIKSLTGRMRDWTEAAGLSGCTLHGLRKTLGKRVADAGGTTRQSMSVLGHEDIKQAELYSEEAEREKLAREAMEKVVEFVQKKRRR